MQRIPIVDARARLATLTRIFIQVKSGRQRHNTAASPYSDSGVAATGSDMSRRRQQKWNNETSEISPPMDSVLPSSYKSRHDAKSIVPYLVLECAAHAIRLYQCSCT